MKTPVWEATPGALAALLNGMRAGPAGGFSGSIARAHLYSFQLASGTALQFTDADVDVTYPRDLYTRGDLYAAGDLYDTDAWSSKGVVVDVDSTRATGHWKRGLDVDTWVVVVAPRAVDPLTGALFPDTIDGVPWIQAARQGALDGANVTVDRAYFASWQQPWSRIMTPVGVLRMFAGQPAEVDVGDLTVAITLNDYRQKLLANSPTRLYQAGCSHTLFDAGCQLAASAFAVAGSCVGGTTQASLKSTAAPPAGSSGTFMLGRVVMTSGLNIGFQRTVRDWSMGSFALLNPLPYNVAPGDTFTAYPGCDKSQATCTKFANLVNFGGESFIPAAETAV